MVHKSVVFHMWRSATGKSPQTYVSDESLSLAKLTKPRRMLYAVW